MAEALIDAGADINTRDGSIGTPLANTVGCWQVAHLLLDRDARVDEPWVAAAMGLLDRLDELLGEQPTPAAVSQASGPACSAAQRRAAEYLLSRGPDLNWVPTTPKTPWTPPAAQEPNATTSSAGSKTSMRARRQLTPEAL